MKRARRDGPLTDEHVAYRLGIAASHWVGTLAVSEVEVSPDGNKRFRLSTRDGSYYVTITETKDEM